MGLYKSSNEMLFRQWERHGQPKIALKVKDDKEMVRAWTEGLG
jgi:peptidyl-tRNA hydrolase